VTWKELGRTHGANQYTLLNLPKRLKSLTADPWEGITRIKQTLPSLSTSRKSGL
jgi:DNA primase